MSRPVDPCGEEAARRGDCRCDEDGSGAAEWDGAMVRKAERPEYQSGRSNSLCKAAEDRPYGKNVTATLARSQP